jgi:hypothetical protein
VVAAGLHYYFNRKFPKSSSYHRSLDFKPQGASKKREVKTVGEFIRENDYLEKFSVWASSLCWDRSPLTATVFK